MKKYLKKLHLHQYIDRKAFDSLAKKWLIDKGVIGFSTWQVTCSLVGSFILGLNNFRDSEKVFGTPKSTFSDALSNRSFGFFEALCDQIINQIHQSTRPYDSTEKLREQKQSLLRATLKIGC